MQTYSLSEEEAELIDAIRNYRRSFPNGYPNYLFYVRRLFEELVEMP